MAAIALLAQVVWLKPQPMRMLMAGTTQVMVIPLLFQLQVCRQQVLQADLVLTPDATSKLAFVA